MKLKLIEPGYSSFTGEFGGVNFVNGVSVTDVSDSQARLFASLIRVECEDGKDPGSNAQYQAALNMAAVSVNFPTLKEIQDRERDTVEMEPISESVVNVSYTREQLESIADKEGIAGLRAVADPLKIKGTSVNKLISAILAYAPAPSVQFIDGVSTEVVSEG